MPISTSVVPITRPVSPTALSERTSSCHSRSTVTGPRPSTTTGSCASFSPGQPHARSCRAARTKAVAREQELHHNMTENTNHPEQDVQVPEEEAPESETVIIAESEDAAPSFDVEQEGNILTLPLLPLRGTVVFPLTVVP